MNNENTQLTSASGYDTKRMIFSDPQSGTIPNSLPQINYKRILISTRNEDGTVGDLILPTSKLFSFGVSENTNPDTKKVNGYVMPLCLWNRDNPTKEEKEWSTTFDNIIERCKDHLVANREEIEIYELEKRDLKKFNPLYWKKDKGKVVEGSGPTLYAKLIVSKKQNKIITEYFNADGESVDPLNLLGKYCYARAAVKIESIFIGNKISMQVKLYECEVKLMQTGMKRLMKRPKARKRVLVEPVKESLPLDDDDDDNDDNDVDDVEKMIAPLDGDGIDDSDDDEEDPASKKKVAKPKRRVKRVVRKTA